MKRVIWCTPGNPQETNLVAGVTQRGFTVVRRCVEAVDVLAASSVEPLAAVVVDVDTPRLSADTVAAIPGSHKRVVIAVVADQHAAERARSWGINTTVPYEDADALDRIVAALDSNTFNQCDHSDSGMLNTVTPAGFCRTTVVYGAPGSPGRSTIALGLAEEWSRTGDRVCLIDADTIGPAQALLVGMTEDVSGVLVAARYADQGALDIRSLGSACRRLTDRLWLMSGVGSADRWHQLRPASFERVLRMCAENFDRVVIDTNPLLNVEDHDDALPGGMPVRDCATRLALSMCDSAVVVTQPDAVSVSRLVVDMPAVMSVITHSRVSVVVNRASRRDADSPAHIGAVLTESGVNVPIHVVPEDSGVAVCRRSGSLLSEVGASRKVRRSLSRLGSSVAA